jgi:hypothetical protein
VDYSILAWSQFEVFWRGYFWGSVGFVQITLTQKEQDQNLKL